MTVLWLWTVPDARGTIGWEGMYGQLARQCVNNHYSTMCSRLQARNAHFGLRLQTRKGVALPALSLQTGVGLFQSEKGDEPRQGLTGVFLMHH